MIIEFIQSTKQFWYGYIIGMIVTATVAVLFIHWGLIR